MRQENNGSQTINPKNASYSTVSKYAVKGCQHTSLDAHHKHKLTYVLQVKDQQEHTPSDNTIYTNTFNLEKADTD